MAFGSAWLNLLAFAVCGVVIWWAGTRLENLADQIAERTGMGQAFVGVLLLAAATSLPELATTVTAVAVLNDATLAVNNLLGGTAMQTALLVVADAVKRKRGALTFFSPDFALLVQGLGLLLMLLVVIAGFTTEGSPAVAGVSGWFGLLLAVYVATMYLVYRNRRRPRWKPESADAPGGEEQERTDDADEETSGSEIPISRLLLAFGGMSLLVLAGGFFATHSAEALAEQTGLGSAFMGATLLALATSLPELSTTIAASRRGHYTMAMSNVFGSNAFDVCLLVLVDVLTKGGSVLAEVQRSDVFVASIAAVMTAIYLFGLLERENRTVLGIGWDSMSAAAVYAAAMAVLYTMTN